MMLALLLMVGCGAVEGIMDDWFTRTPPTDPSDAERLDDSLNWLMPSPFRELLSAIVGGVAVFWTTKRRDAKK